MSTQLVCNKAAQLHSSKSQLPRLGVRSPNPLVTLVFLLNTVTMPPKTYLKTKAQAEEHRIYFGPHKYSRRSCANIPDDHCEKFEIIQALGHTLFAPYMPSPDIDTPDKPWKGKNAQKAQRLAHESALCREDNLLEAGWREGIEFKVYERFRIEVAW